MNRDPLHQDAPGSQIQGNQQMDFLLYGDAVCEGIVGAARKTTLLVYTALIQSVLCTSITVCL